VEEPIPSQTEDETADSLSVSVLGEPTTPMSSAPLTGRRNGRRLTGYTGRADTRKEKYDTRDETGSAEQEGTCVAFKLPVKISTIPGPTLGNRPQKQKNCWKLCFLLDPPRGYIMRTSGRLSQPSCERVAGQ
jgi:hypothetical protein